MDTTETWGPDRLLTKSQETLSDLISRRRQLETELDELIAEREDAHHDALCGTDPATLDRLIVLNRKVTRLRAENAALRAGLADIVECLR